MPLTELGRGGGIALAVDLLNSWDELEPDPELLSERWLRFYLGFHGYDEAAAAVREKDVAVAKALRERLRQAFDATMEEYEGAREKVARFINAPSAREIVFLRGATEGLNLVAYAWGLDNLGPGDVVLVTELEHHSNFVPWQYIAQRTGAAFRAIPLDDHGELRLDALDEVAGSERVKVVANNLVSNALGTINPVEQLSAWAHERGAIMVVDAAQAAPHHPVDVQALDCDFLAFSAHKLCGPTSVGALWGRQELLETMAPFDLDGVAIRAGHHCCQPLMAKLGVAATNRASFYLYSLPEEVDRLVEGVHKARKLFA